MTVVCAFEISLDVNLVGKRERLRGSAPDAEEIIHSRNHGLVGWTEHGRAWRSFGDATACSRKGRQEQRDRERAAAFNLTRTFVRAGSGREVATLRSQVIDRGS